ncbi:hypothetical protein [Devosia lacusdianchii]|uniref:hypothetical protein n=1 Tax=Devosia lacusdianchii TaxID=2917991 RepID=UPI001F056C38|nr:hypothetical protein [Devosia sp. JXJ CY 41]
MTLRGWATFAWQADYSQFYLIDGDDLDFAAPIEITPEMERRSLAVLERGLVIYTGGCLQQHIRIQIYDTEPDHPPVEVMSTNPWTRIETVEARFPSQRFTLSGPSTPYPLPGGPTFFLDSASITARIHWMEFQGIRDDSVPVDPDIIEVSIWPS